jgi:Helicase associated domain
MKSLRERNNLASKLSNEKALERKYAEDYEYEVIRTHSKLANTEVYHWSKIPEEWLYLAGYITDYTIHRHERLMAKKEKKEGFNRLKDYGADGLSRTKDESGNYTYDLIQAKYYISRKITAGDIGTFLATTINLMIKDKKSKGYLYSSSPLQIDLADCVASPDYPIKHILYPWKHPDGRTLKKVLEASLERDLPLRDYQKKALKDLTKKGMNALNIPCRMGKTLILGHHLLSVKPRHIILLAPLKVSVLNLKNRLTSFLPNHSPLLVDSDTDGTTSMDEVIQFLKTNTQTVIYSTFDSALNILDKLSPELLEDTFVGVDEVHNINDELAEFINKFNDGLIMSATMPEEVLSMLNINEVVYISFADGILGGWITDYNLWLPYLTKASDGTTFVDVDIPLDFKKYNTDLTAKALYLATVMLQTGSRRCIAYMSCQEECDQFMEIVRDIFENYHGLNVWTNKIDSTVSQVKREEILEDFQYGHPDTTFHILTSVRILDEAVDIPRCDSEFITQVGKTSSDIRMMQRSQRGSTLDSKNPSKVNNIILWADGWEKCIDSLELLKEADPEFHKKLRVCHTNYDLQNTVRKDVETQNYEMCEWSILRCVSPWERKRLEWERFYKENGRSPSQGFKDLNENRLARWQSTQRIDYKKKAQSMTPERIKALEKTEGWKWEEEDTWEQSRQKWEIFFKENGRSPSQGFKDLEEKRLATWQSKQRMDYKKKAQWLTQERIEALEKTEGWKWEEEDTWEPTRQDWEQFYKENRKNPSNSSKNKEEKRLSQWQSTQRNNYKKRAQCMTQERIEALEKTEGWKWEEEDTWELNRKEFEEFYKKNGKNPSPNSENAKEKHLGGWIFQQRNNYKKRAQCMTQERIEALEKTEGWNWEEEDTWEPTRQDWEQFYKENRKNPSNSSKNKEEKRLAQWQSQQRKNYKKKAQCMTQERIEALEKTEGWKWEEEDTWEQTRQEWEQFYKQNKKTPSSKSKDAKEKYLGMWKGFQRKNYKKKAQCMTQERIEALEKTEGWKWEEDDTWELTRQDWEQFYKENRKNPSYHSKNNEEKLLATWQSTQRNNYKKKETCMTQERIEALEKTEGWKWEEDDTWELTRQDWEQFYKENGKNPRQESKNLEEKRLAQWQSAQRKNYKKKAQCMTPERIEALEKTEGWKWVSK